MWLATGRTDMRKGFDGLALIVQETLESAIRIVAICLSFAVAVAIASNVCGTMGRGCACSRRVGAGAGFLAVDGRRDGDNLPGWRSWAICSMALIGECHRRKLGVRRRLASDSCLQIRSAVIPSVVTDHVRFASSDLAAAPLISPSARARMESQVRAATPAIWVTLKQRGPAPRR